MQKHLALSSSHSAVNVDVVTTPRGLTLWLVRSYAVPLVSLEFAMRGGAAQDPAEKAGLGSLTSGLLDFRIWITLPSSLFMVVVRRTWEESAFLTVDQLS